MISIENKITIMGYLGDLSSNINTIDTNNVNSRFPSLPLWILYQEFVQKILHQFPVQVDDEYEKEQNLEIFDFLDMDAFFVDANAGFINEKANLENQIKTKCKAIFSKEGKTKK